MIKLKDIIPEGLLDDLKAGSGTIPYKIGFAQKGTRKTDFEKGLVDEFFKFFYIHPGKDQPDQNSKFIQMANAIAQRYPGDKKLETELDNIGDVSNDLFAYFMDPEPEAGYDLNNLTQKGGAEAVWDYMKKSNKLASRVYIDTVKGGAAKSTKISQGLKGITGMLNKAHDIFTSSFGPPKRKKIGFKFKGELN